MHYVWSEAWRKVAAFTSYADDAGLMPTAVAGVTLPAGGLKGVRPVLGAEIPGTDTKRARGVNDADAGRIH